MEFALRNVSALTKIVCPMSSARMEFVSEFVAVMISVDKVKSALTECVLRDA